MKYSEGFEKLGLPSYFKFGIELEAFNVKTQGKDSLYTGKSAEFINSKNWHMATQSEESLVGKGGAELISPILTDSTKDWQTISMICEHIKKYPGKYADEVVADGKCGLHVHFDSSCLTQDPKIMENFKRIYAESEELLYKMCNANNEPLRKNAINKNFKGLNLIFSIWRNGMAAPSGKKILRQIENGTLKVSYKKFGKLKLFASKYKLNETRYHGLNLTNIGNPNKNTIEFRMANGTLDPNIIKQNIFLYASLINSAIESTKNPEKYKTLLNEFYKTNVDEKTKVQNFLNLIMQNEQDKSIYMQRWVSVHNDPVFDRNEHKGFAKNRFKREDFKKVAYTTPISLVKQALKKINELKSPSKTYENKGDIDYDR